ncbi:isoliquiritigenin 2'-O-methyltransferase-like isoform X3 [Glycine soja]|uniref:isoliquiritigenin 2'-O-methyltransferase-like isoform X3 n=1 Tax=Glycine soja TaxID=3848 RepID=UPI00103F85E0|nr:isoliquiritigenin 2'-O-methyltransferase-like isoform X3 [Glycine soja]
MMSSKENEEDDTYLSALTLCFSRIFPAILNAAVDLNLFDIIDKAESSTLSASEIASLLPNPHPQLANRLERILPVLASYSLLNCSIRTTEDGVRERLYALSPIGQYFASDDDGGSLGPLSSLFHRGYFHVLKDVKDAIVDPNNNNHFENVHGIPPYDYMEKNAELNDIFYKAVIHAAPLELKRALKLYKGFEGVSTLVDVGGGAGETLKQILPKYPSMKGINFDLPLVIQKAPPHPGIEQIAGDMFESVPTGDAILVKFVCHNWADEDCIKFLRNFHKALPQHGKVIVFEYIIPEVPNPSYISKHTCTLDNVMFLAHGGRERTQKEFENLCKSSGFSKFHVASSDISSTLGVMEFYK